MNKVFPIVFSCLFFLFFQITACQNTPNSGAKSASDKTTSAASTNAADFQAKVMFSAWGLDRTSFTASAKVEKGTLRLGDKVDGINGAGARTELTVNYIKVAGKEGAAANVGETALVELATSTGTAESLGEDFFIVNKGGTIATDTKPVVAASPSESSQNTQLTAIISGKPWKGAGSSHLFYAKGISNMNGGKPFMTLAFKTSATPDDRQLTFKIIGFSGKTGKFKNADIEVLFSGSADGDTKKSKLFGCKSPTTLTDFVLDITEWRSVSAGEALISGNFNGTLKGIFTDGTEKVENGQFFNVKVKVYNEKY